MNAPLKESPLPFVPSHQERGKELSEKGKEGISLKD